MKKLAIIPARSGSKGLPDKNIKELNGKPLMAYSIEAALLSGCFDKVMVSTDSQTYADIAIKYGADVPFLRSEINSSDKAGSWDMVEEVLAGYEKMGEKFDVVCLLQPTSPLRSSEDIISAFDVFNSKNAIAVVSVCESAHSPLLINTLDKECSLDGFIKSSGANRRQDMGKYYRLNGAIYIVSTEELKKNHNLYRERSYAYIMPELRSVDIDTIVDFEYAQFLLSRNE